VGVFFLGRGGVMGGYPNTLYFAAGINGETAGLFGAITAVPEPTTYSMLGVGLGFLAWMGRRRRQV
jgi:PEP-CTERM motif